MIDTLILGLVAAGIIAMIFTLVLIAIEYKEMSAIMITLLLISYVLGYVIEVVIK